MLRESSKKPEKKKSLPSKNSVLIGVDLVEIDRVYQLFLRFGEQFLDRLFVPEELEFYRHKGQKRFREGVAALFASKEAVKKIFLQRGERIGWKTVRVLHTKMGKPVVQLAPPFDGYFGSISLSLSHSASLVIAVAVAGGGKA